MQTTVVDVVNATVVVAASSSPSSAVATLPPPGGQVAGKHHGRRERKSPASFGPLRSPSLLPWSWKFFRLPKHQHIAIELPATTATITTFAGLRPTESRRGPQPASGGSHETKGEPRGHENRGESDGQRKADDTRHRSSFSVFPNRYVGVPPANSSFVVDYPLSIAEGRAEEGGGKRCLVCVFYCR